MSEKTSALDKPIYARIRLMVQQIPAGKVATYGQIAKIVGKCTARMVGYTMAGLPPDTDVPWQRVVNSQGQISPRGNQLSSVRHIERLQAEGIEFSEAKSINLALYQWSGPDWRWLAENGFDPESHPDFEL